MIRCLCFYVRCALCAMLSHFSRIPHEQKFDCFVKILELVGWWSTFSWHLVWALSFFFKLYSRCNDFSWRFHFTKFCSVFICYLLQLIWADPNVVSCYKESLFFVHCTYNMLRFFLLMLPFLYECVFAIQNLLSEEYIQKLHKQTFSRFLWIFLNDRSSFA